MNPETLFDSFQNQNKKPPRNAIAEWGSIDSVNFHLWQPCNMRCRFCFATFQDVKQSFLPKGHLPEEEACRVVELLCRTGVGKITFAGGEPMLCPWLPSLLKLARSFSVKTMIVTNGTRLSKEWLDKFGQFVDWIALSVDSLNTETNALSGRKTSGDIAPDELWYIEKADLVKDHGIRFKVNTVVHRLNASEDLSSFIRATQPERWKLFQVLPVSGQNDGKVGDLLISGEDFEAFVVRHKQLLPETTIVPESNELMTGSYLMVDPAGRFYDNTRGQHTYSRPILEVGVVQALREICFDWGKFNDRGGVYNW